MLVDSTTILVRSGKGGDGLVSFLRMKYVPKGGPDGGIGGNGGSVILKASANVETLLDFTGRKHWFAEAGKQGGPKQQFGKSAPDLIVPVPPGTLVYHDETDELLVDLAELDQTFVVAQGGRGGFGNDHFKSATNQVPRQFTHGEPGVEVPLRLELKLIADVGLVGLPNAGKSTLLSVISKATPKIANYPFTTLEPNLGIAELSGFRRLVVADIPGLIEGAHEGAGLGIRFLRHVERTRLLVHVLEIEPADGSDPIENYMTIRRELAGYSDTLSKKPQIIAISKTDLMQTGEDRAAAIELIRERIGRKVLAFSSATGDGLQALISECWDRVERDKQEERDTEKQAEKLAEKLAEEQTAEQTANEHE